MKRYIYVLFMFITLNLWACSDSEPSTDGGGEEVVDKTTDCQSANEKGAYTTWYKPANGWVGDPIPYYDNGKFYIFYLQDWRSGYPFLHPWHMVYSTDLSSFTFGGETIPAEKKRAGCGLMALVGLSKIVLPENIALFIPGISGNGKRWECLHRLSC